MTPVLHLYSSYVLVIVSKRFSSLVSQKKDEVDKVPRKPNIDYDPMMTSRVYFDSKNEDDTNKE